MPGSPKSISPAVTWWHRSNVRPAGRNRSGQANDWTAKPSKFSTRGPAGRPTLRRAAPARGSGSERGITAGADSPGKPAHCFPQAAQHSCAHRSGRAGGEITAGVQTTRHANQHTAMPRQPSTVALTCLEGQGCAVHGHPLAVALHRELLDVGRKVLQSLLVGQQGGGRVLQEGGVPHLQAGRQRRNATAAAAVNAVQPWRLCGGVLQEGGGPHLQAGRRTMQRQ